MKKAGWLLVLIFPAAKDLSAQTFAEWFEQNSTQLKYLAVQIAALKGYSAALEDGYGITGNGLDGIESIQQADITLHTNYFSSLQNVTPAVSSDPRVTAIEQYCEEVPALAGSIAVFGGGLEATIAGNLRAACNQDLAWLKALLTDGDLDLKDSERLELIGVLYSNAKARFAFAVEVFWELKVNKDEKGKQD